MVCDFLVEGIVQVCVSQQGLNGEQHGANLESGRPLFILENVKADAAEFVNVRVVDFGSEQNLGWDHGVFIR